MTKKYYPHNILLPDRKDKNEKYEWVFKKKKINHYLPYVC